MTVQTLNLEDREAVKVGFWKRQFQAEATSKQRDFDWVFGVIMPVVCVFFDPLVFSGHAIGQALLGAYKPFAYVLSFISIMWMMAWLIWGASLKWLNSVLSGLFVLGGLVSLSVGIMILPFSLLGLLLLVGALGFTPLLAGFVYLRNAYRAFSSAAGFLEEKVRVGSFILAMIFSGALPWVVNSEINRVLARMENGNAQTIRAGGKTLKYAWPLVNPDRLALAYIKSSDEDKGSERTIALSDAYRELTGRDVEMDARLLAD